MMTSRSSTAKITSVEKVVSNEDLLGEILVKLPTKAVVRMKLVSRLWLSLISSARFAHRHTRFLLNNPSSISSTLLLDVIYESLPSEFKFLHLNPNTTRLPLFDVIDALTCVSILQSCAGLLLCVSKCVNRSNYFVCNPATKKVMMIVLPRNGEHVGINLAFDPLKSQHYKIVYIWRQKLAERDPESKKHYLFYISIYSSQTDSWGSVKRRDQLALNKGIQFHRAIFLNGLIHWDCSENESMYFDVENECLKTMPMPILPIGDRCFGASGGHLHIVTEIGFSHLQFIMFEMEPDYSQWYMKYNINLESYNISIPSRRRNRFHSYLQFCIVQSHEEEGHSLVVALPSGNAISYNLKDRTVKRLPQFSTDNLCYGFDYPTTFCAYQYFETLAHV